MTEERIVYHNNEPIVSPDFDLEDSFCSRLNKIIGIADLFSCIGESGERQITKVGAFGISRALEDAAEELRTICYFMMEKDSVYHLYHRAKARGHDVDTVLRDLLDKDPEEVTA
jgi:hypothetical protein